MSRWRGFDENKKKLFFFYRACKKQVWPLCLQPPTVTEKKKLETWNCNWKKAVLESFKMLKDVFSLIIYKEVKIVLQKFVFFIYLGSTSQKFMSSKCNKKNEALLNFCTWTAKRPLKSMVMSVLPNS